jgi:hypothetical protein
MLVVGAAMAKKPKKSADPCRAARGRIHKTLETLFKGSWLLAPDPDPGPVRVDHGRRSVTEAVNRKGTPIGFPPD